MDMVASLFNGAETFEQISISLRQIKAPCDIWWKLVKQFKSERLKDYTILYMYIAQGQEQITPRR